MGREVLLSSVLGFATGGVATYMLHRALWKNSDAQAQRIEALIPGYEGASASKSEAANPYFDTREPDNTLEGYMRQRAAQGWNSLVDSVHMRLLNMPRTLVQIRDDAATMISDESDVPELVLTVESTETESQKDV